MHVEVEVQTVVSRTWVTRIPEDQKIGLVRELIQLRALARETLPDGTRFPNVNNLLHELEESGKRLAAEEDDHSECCG